MASLQITHYILAISITFVFIAGVITRNYSHVDRLWSVLPAIYVLVWMRDFGSNPRFVIAAVLIILWGMRLTTNFAIKGGYAFTWKKGFYGEDYRWEVMRKKIPNRFLFELFNLFFISAFQLVLIYMFTLPVYFLGSITGPLTNTDVVLFALHFLFLAGETAADWQQLRYYSKRADESEKGNRRVQLGFNTFGLWKYSRHPNYVCELGQWFVVYFYLHSKTGWHYTFAGSSILLLLFVGSTILAESITSSKYPEYSNWKKMTAPWIPGFAFLPERGGKADFLNN